MKRIYLFKFLMAVSMIFLPPLMEYEQPLGRLVIPFSTIVIAIVWKHNEMYGLPEAFFGLGAGWTLWYLYETSEMYWSHPRPDFWPQAAFLVVMATMCMTFVAMPRRVRAYVPN